MSEEKDRVRLIRLDELLSYPDDGSCEAAFRRGFHHGICAVHDHSEHQGGKALSLRVLARLADLAGRLRYDGKEHPDYMTDFSSLCTSKRGQAHPPESHLNADAEDW